ncbi:MAG: HNH endonuclease [Rhodospirillales bacterium]|nr:HNH endonuclease [Rhodospirillales bacterium]
MCLRNVFNLALEPVLATRIPSNEARARRATLTGEDKSRFAEQAIESLSDFFHKSARRTVIEYCLSFQVHHIMPISLGGNNEEENLALVEPSLHRRIHEYITRQTSGMEMGEERPILLPFSAERIWGMGMDGERRLWNMNDFYGALDLEQGRISPMSWRHPLLERLVA